MVFKARKIKTLTALQDYVIVSNMQFDLKETHGGILLPFSDGKLEGIHPRWAKVYAIGETQKDVKVGQYILVRHGRWTRGILIEDETGEHTIRRVDTNDIMLVSDTEMYDETVGKSL